MQKLTRVAGDRRACKVLTVFRGAAVATTLLSIFATGLITILTVAAAAAASAAGFAAFLFVAILVGVLLTSSSSPASPAASRAASPTQMPTRATNKATGERQTRRSFSNLDEDMLPAAPANTWPADPIGSAVSELREIVDLFFSSA